MKPLLLSVCLFCTQLTAATVEELQAQAEESRAAELFNAAHRYALRGSPGTALEKYQLLVKNYATSRWAGAAQWETVKLLADNHEYVEAFDACQLLIDHFPAYYPVAIQQQYRIAQTVLTQQEQRVLKPEAEHSRTLPTAVDAGMMLKIIAKNAPHDPKVVDAQYQRAISLERQGKTDQAREAHEQFLEFHPTHSLADDATYQIAYIDLKAWRKMRSSAPALRNKAELSLLYFLYKFPESDKVAQAIDEVTLIHEAEKRELTDLAEFYEKQGNLRSAAIYYLDLIHHYPDMAELPGLQEKLSQWTQTWPDLITQPPPPAATPAQPAAPPLPADYTPLLYPLLPVPPPQSAA
jgi:outer membrane protein assembly factor BamD (BamD/ComL family)